MESMQTLNASDVCDLNKAESISNECPSTLNPFKFVTMASPKAVVVHKSPESEERVKERECTERNPETPTGCLNVCQDAKPSTSSQDDTSLSNSYTEVIPNENVEKPEKLTTLSDESKVLLNEEDIKSSPVVSSCDQAEANEANGDNVPKVLDESFESKKEAMSEIMEVDAPTENNLSTVVQKTSANVFSEGNLFFIFFFIYPSEETHRYSLIV